MIISNITSGQVTDLRNRLSHTRLFVVICCYVIDRACLYNYYATSIGLVSTRACQSCTHLRSLLLIIKSFGNRWKDTRLWRAAFTNFWNANRKISCLKCTPVVVTKSTRVNFIEGSPVVLKYYSNSFYEN